MDIINQFSAIPNNAYLNTANAGILSKNTYQWRRNYDTGFALGGSHYRQQLGPILGELKNNHAELLGACSDQIFLVPNFSFRINTLLDGLDSGYRILIFDGDFPAVIYPVISRAFIYRKIKRSNSAPEQLL